MFGFDHARNYASNEGLFVLISTDYKISDSLEDLDSQILFKTVLDPILGINDLTNDDRISYKPEILNPTQIKDEVDSGKYVVGFGLFPLIN